MRDDQRLSEHEIWEAAVAAVDAAAPKTRTQIAGELGVTLSAVTKALEKPGPRYLKLQIRLVGHLTEYRVEGPVYIAKRKGD